MARYVKFRMHRLLLAVVGLAVIMPWHSPQPSVQLDPLANPIFSGVTVLQPAAEPKGVVLLLAPGMAVASPWQKVAQAVTGLDYLVAFVDSNAYLQRSGESESTCIDVAADLASLDEVLSGRFALPARRRPVVVGFEQGATLAYAALTQAATDQFETVISVDFCPQPMSTGAFCAPRQPDPAAAAGSWFVLPSASAQPCDDTVATAARSGQVPASRWLPLPGETTEHGKLSERITALLRWLDFHSVRQNNVR